MRKDTLHAHVTEDVSQTGMDHVGWQSSLSLEMTKHPRGDLVQSYIEINRL